MGRPAPFGPRYTPNPGFAFLVLDLRIRNTVHEQFEFWGSMATVRLIRPSGEVVPNAGSGFEGQYCVACFMSPRPATRETTGSYVFILPEGAFGETFTLWFNDAVRTIPFSVGPGR